MAKVKSPTSAKTAVGVDVKSPAASTASPEQALAQSPERLQKLLVAQVNAENRFRDIALELMRGWALLIGDEKYHIAELEFYLHNRSHPDPYVHKSPEQLGKSGHWYFHRAASAKKGFTLKGIDLTFGEEGKEYGGILIRAIHAYGKNAGIEGPSKVVDEILDMNGVESVKELFVCDGYSPNAFECDCIRLVPVTTALPSAAGKIAVGPRFGLKSGKDYHAALYRYRAWPHLATKDKKGLLNSGVSYPLKATVSVGALATAVTKADSTAGI